MTMITDGYYAGWTYYYVKQGYMAGIIKAKSMERLEEFLKARYDYLGEDTERRPCTWDELEYFTGIGCVCEISTGEPYR